MEKWIAAFLQASSAVLFIMVGTIGDEESVVLAVPALASGISGLLLWARAVKRETALPPEPRKPAELPPTTMLTARVEEMLESLQNEVAQLRDEQRFHQELYSGQRKQDQLG